MNSFRNKNLLYFDKSHFYINNNIPFSRLINKKNINPGDYLNLFKRDINEVLSLDPNNKNLDNIIQPLLELYQHIYSIYIYLYDIVFNRFNIYINYYNYTLKNINYKADPFYNNHEILFNIVNLIQELLNKNAITFKILYNYKENTNNSKINIPYFIDKLDLSTVKSCLQKIKKQIIKYNSDIPNYQIPIQYEIDKQRISPKEVPLELYIINNTPTIHIVLNNKKMFLTLTLLNNNVYVNLNNIGYISCSNIKCCIRGDKYEYYIIKGIDNITVTYNIIFNNNLDLVMNDNIEFNPHNNKSINNDYKTKIQSLLNIFNGLPLNWLLKGILKYKIYNIQNAFNILSKISTYNLSIDSIDRINQLIDIDYNQIKYDQNKIINQKQRTLTTSNLSYGITFDKRYYFLKDKYDLLYTSLNIKNTDFNKLNLITFKYWDINMNDLINVYNINIKPKDINKCVKVFNSTHIYRLYIYFVIHNHSYIDYKFCYSHITHNTQLNYMLYLQNDQSMPNITNNDKLSNIITNNININYSNKDVTYSYNTKIPIDDLYELYIFKNKFYLIDKYDNVYEYIPNKHKNIIQLTNDIRLKYVGKFIPETQDKLYGSINLFNEHVNYGSNLFNKLATLSSDKIHNLYPNLNEEAGEITFTIRNNNLLIYDSHINIPTQFNKEITHNNKLFTSYDDMLILFIIVYLYLSPQYKLFKSPIQLYDYLFDKCNKFDIYNILIECFYDKHNINEFFKSLYKILTTSKQTHYDMNIINIPTWKNLDSIYSINNKDHLIEVMTYTINLFYPIETIHTWDKFLYMTNYLDISSLCDFIYTKATNQYPIWEHFLFNNIQPKKILTNTLTITSKVTEGELLSLCIYKLRQLLCYIYPVLRDSLKMNTQLIDTSTLDSNIDKVHMVMLTRFILPHLNSDTVLYNISCLDEIYTTKKNNKYEYTNYSIDHNKQLNDKILPYKFDLNDFLINASATFKTIILSANLLYINWVNILPYASSYKKFKSSFDINNIFYIDQSYIFDIFVKYSVIDILTTDIDSTIYNFRNTNLYISYYNSNYNIDIPYINNISTIKYNNLNEYLNKQFNKYHKNNNDCIDYNDFVLWIYKLGIISNIYTPNGITNLLTDSTNKELANIKNILEIKDITYRRESIIEYYKNTYVFNPSFIINKKDKYCFTVNNTSKFLNIYALLTLFNNKLPDDIIDGFNLYIDIYYSIIDLTDKNSNFYNLIKDIKHLDLLRYNNITKFILDKFKSKNDFICNKLFNIDNNVKLSFENINHIAYIICNIYEKKINILDYDIFIKNIIEHNINFNYEKLTEYLNGIIQNEMITIHNYTKYISLYCIYKFIVSNTYSINTKSINNLILFLKTLETAKINNNLFTKDDFNVLKCNSKSLNGYLYDCSWGNMFSMNYMQQIMIYNKFLNTRIMFITGGTGTGKSTQVPKLLLYAGLLFENPKKYNIICTEPRKNSTTSNAINIGYQLNCPLDIKNILNAPSNLHFMIQYKHGDDLNHSLQSKYPTLNILIDKAVLNILLYLPCCISYNNNKFKQCYNTIIVDEAHEHNVNMDYILSIMKIYCQKNINLKLVIISATMDYDEPIYRNFYAPISDLLVPNNFYVYKKQYDLYMYDNNHSINYDNYNMQRYLNSIIDRRIDISEPYKLTMYNITDIYLNLPHEKLLDENYKNTKILDIILKEINKPSTRDILVFKSGATPIKLAVEYLNKSTPNDVLVIPYFSALSNDIKKFIENIYKYTNIISLDKTVDITVLTDHNIFISGTPKGYKHIVIISTNIAEASITIPSLTCVIDDGLHNINIYNDYTNMYMIMTSKISLQNSKQRRGRVGRVADGIVYYLYDKNYLIDQRPYYEIANINIINILVALLTNVNDNVITTLFNLYMNNNQNNNVINDIMIYRVENMENYNNYHELYQNLNFDVSMINNNIYTRFYTDILLLDKYNFYIISPNEYNIDRDIYGNFVRYNDNRKPITDNLLLYYNGTDVIDINMNKNIIQTTDIYYHIQNLVIDISQLTVYPIHFIMCIIFGFVYEIMDIMICLCSIILHSNSIRLDDKLVRDELIEMYHVYSVNYVRYPDITNTIRSFKSTIYTVEFMDFLINVKNKYAPIFKIDPNMPTIDKIDSIFTRIFYNNLVFNSDDISYMYNKKLHESVDLPIPGAYKKRKYISIFNYMFDKYLYLSTKSPIDESAKYYIYFNSHNILLENQTYYIIELLHPINNHNIFKHIKLAKKNILKNKLLRYENIIKDF